MNSSLPLYYTLAFAVHSKKERNDWLFDLRQRTSRSSHCHYANHLSYYVILLGAHTLAAVGGSRTPCVSWCLMCFQLNSLSLPGQGEQVCCSVNCEDWLNFILFFLFNLFFFFSLYSFDFLSVDGQRRMHERTHTPKLRWARPLCECRPIRFVSFEEQQRGESKGSQAKRTTGSQDRGPAAFWIGPRRDEQLARLYAYSENKWNKYPSLFLHSTSWIFHGSYKPVHKPFAIKCIS